MTETALRKTERRRKKVAHDIAIAYARNDDELQICKVNKP